MDSDRSLAKTAQITSSMDLSQGVHHRVHQKKFQTLSNECYPASKTFKPHFLGNTNPLYRNLGWDSYSLETH